MTAEEILINTAKSVGLSDLNSEWLSYNPNRRNMILSAMKQYADQERKKVIEAALVGLVAETYIKGFYSDYATKNPLP